MAYKPEEIATMLINAIPNDTPKSERLYLLQTLLLNLALTTQYIVQSRI